MKTLAISSFAAVLCLSVPALAETPPIQGIVVWSPGGLGPDFARADFYVSLDSHPRNHLAMSPEGRRYHILRKEMVEILSLSVFASDLSTDEQRASIEADLARLRTQACSILALRPLLPTVEAEAETRLARYAAGHHLRHGVWCRSASAPAPRPLADATIAKSGRIETLAGKVYERACVTRIELDAAILSHATGVARIVAADLTEESRARIPFDFAGAERAKAQREAAEAAAWREAVLDRLRPRCGLSQGEIEAALYQRAMDRLLGRGSRCSARHPQ